MGKPILERVTKHIIIYTNKGESHIAYYGDDKEELLKIEEEFAKKSELMTVQEVISKSVINQQDNVVFFRNKEEDKGEGRVKFIKREYRNGKLLKEFPFNMNSVHIWLVDNKPFLNFDSAHSYGKNKVEDYKFVDVAIIERTEMKRDKIAKKMIYYPVYELWIDKVYITEFEDKKPLKESIKDLKLARKIMEYKRELYEVYVDDNLESKFELKHLARNRGLQLRNHLPPHNQVKIKKVTSILNGHGRFGAEFIPEAKNEFVKEDVVFYF